MYQRKLQLNLTIMKDSTLVTTVQVISNNDTTNYSINKEIVEHFIKDKSTDYSHYVEILIPVIVALLTLILTKFFDNWSENKKHKRELLREQRKLKTHLLTNLITLKTSLGKTHFPNPDYEDFLNWTADKMVGTNPFEDLRINSIILFRNNNSLISLIDKLFNNANIINSNFNWTKKEHPSSNLDIAKEIYDDIEEVIKKISKVLN